MNLMPVLEVLGIIGLIMIVLEVALDLKLSKEKIPVILKSFVIALLCLLINAGLIAWIFKRISGISGNIAFCNPVYQYSYGVQPRSKY